MSAKKFVHLHNHTHYSLLDGLARPEDYCNVAKEQGSDAVAITDHGVSYGLIDFYQNAKKIGIKPILGVEFYQARRTRHDKDPQLDTKPYHLVLLAKNFVGYQNLLKLTTLANREGYYYKPRIDWELIEKYSEGLICLSACLYGIIPNALVNNRESEARQALDRFVKIYGKENFFLELQDHHSIPEQQIANEKVIALAKETGVGLVATNDCHYARKEDEDAHDTLLCIQTNSQKADTHRMKFTDDFSMRSPEEMWEVFKDVPEACENTVKIAEMCNVEIPLDQTLLPKFPPPEESGCKTEKEYLHKLAHEGFLDRYGFAFDKTNPTEKEKEKIERLKYELRIIDEMGFNAYFLIVWDFVNFAKSNGIIVGPGRGSAAGAILTYCLKITDIEPMRFGLIFERFLNPARVSMPDIDIDFADDRRGEVMEYVRQKYGETNVSQVITFGTMAAKAALKDVARTYEVGFEESNKVAGMIPSKPGTKLKDALTGEPDMRELYKKDPKWKKIIDTALKLEGTIRQAGVHACAVIISDKPLTEYTALQRPPGNKGDHDFISQYSMKPIEKIGLLKMDFLGLKNLTLMDKTIQIAKRTQGVNITLDTIPDGDPKAFELLSKGETTGVFQLESAGMKKYLKQLKPENLEDVIAMVSLYRPGPMEFIPQYIASKHDPSKVKYPHDDLKEILSLTYGIAVYQEQTMQIAQKFAGFSMAEADILRKAIGKKIAELLVEQKVKFIAGAEKLGHKGAKAKEIFEDIIEPFAGYGFNKSHAACYAYIAYLTAYLKAHYPAEFMAALMTADHGDSDRIAIEFDEAERMGINVLPPEINESFKNFTVTDAGDIRFGMMAVKGVGEAVVEQIVEEQKNGPLVDLEDMLHRLPIKVLNKKTLEALIYSGALDKFGERSQMIGNVEKMINYAKEYQKGKNEEQHDIFGLLDANDEGGKTILKLDNYMVATEMQKLKWEKEYLGMYISAHPLDGLVNYISGKYFAIGRISRKNEGKELRIGGLVTSVRKLMTKKGNMMLFAKVEDPTGDIDVVLFSRMYDEYADKFEEDAFVSILGKIDFRNDEKQIVVKEAKKKSLEAMRENANRQGITDNINIKQYRVMQREAAEKQVEEDVVVAEESAVPVAKNPDASEEVKNVVPEIFVIRAPQGTTREKLLQLNQVLLASPGTTPVELEIYSKSAWQKIKLPMGVAYSDVLEVDVRNLLN